MKKADDKCRLKFGTERVNLFTSIQANTDTFANSAAPDETARNEPFHQYLHFLRILLWIFD